MLCLVVFITFLSFLMFYLILFICLSLFMSLFIYLFLIPCCLSFFAVSPYSVYLSLYLCLYFLFLAASGLGIFLFFSRL